MLVFVFYPNISRKTLETPIYRAFEQREMLLKHIPYISRRSQSHTESFIVTLYGNHRNHAA